MKKGVLYSTGELDVLDYYTKISRFLEGFLNGREIATKTYLENFSFLRRGSNSEPIFAKDLRCVDAKMLKLRRFHLKEIKNELTEKQQLVWRYFVPRKAVNFFYATNNEKGKDIGRIFIDIDRQALDAEAARKVTKQLVEEIKNDKEFNKLVRFRIFVMWTGSSFHVYLLLKKGVGLDFYNKYLSYGSKKTSFLTRWANSIALKTGIGVKAGHARERDFIILDSSNTPPGKLARAPFSLHVKAYDKIDGVSVPVSEEELGRKSLIRELRGLTTDDVLRNMTKYRKML